MVKKNTDNFKIVDNFAKTANIPSIPVLESKLDFIPTVTIAIPTYKRSNLLKEALDSAINQVDYFDYDIIVVDNNPERGCETEKLMLSYNNRRLSYYKNTENLQLIGNWNRLYSLAKGEYVVMLHDDDLLYPDFLSVMFSVIDKHSVKYDAFYPPTPVEIFDMRKATELSERTQQTTLYLQNLKPIDFLWSNVVGTPVGLCFKKDSVIKLGGFKSEFPYATDYEFYVRHVYHFTACKVHGYPLCIYRIAENCSFKTESILGLVDNDASIKKRILMTFKNRLYNFLWLRYIDVYVFNSLRHLTKTYNNKEIDIKRDLLAMGYQYNKFDLFVYKIMNKYKIFVSKQKRLEKIVEKNSVLKT